MSHHLSSRPRLRGFTLIELLCVIAIIALMSAILFPVFQRVRENARRNNCQSNLKQIGMGIMMYTQDNDQTYPWAYNGAGNWGQALQPYVKSGQAFACPSNTANSRPMDHGVGTPVPRSYAVNVRIIGEDNSPTAIYPPIILAKLNEPSQKIMVSESADSTGTYGSPWWTSSMWTDAMDPGTGKFSGHIGKVDYLFADGHVKAFLPLETAAPFNMWGNIMNTGGYSGVCTDQSINCDTPEPEIQNGLTTLTKKLD